MHRLLRLLLACFAVLVLAACSPEQGVATEPPAAEMSQPQATPEPTFTATLEPTATAIPTTTPFPTPHEPAPDKTFTGVGNTAILSGEHEISGKAIVAGLQTMIIQVFNYDGKGPQADIRLVMGEDWNNPAAVLFTLESRAYEQEMLLMYIPSSVTADNADRIAIYCPETGEVYASAAFD